MKNKMMKNNGISLIILLVVLIGCNQNNNQEEVGTLKEEVAALKKNVDDLKPGLGEIMGVIHQHHAKLYYASQAENWDLAAYQLDEIKEGLDEATELHDHFKDVKASLKELRGMMDPALSDVESAIREKNKIKLISAYKVLTQSCNACHAAAEHSFIIIQTPTTPMFTNQVFTKVKTK